MKSIFKTLSNYRWVILLAFLVDWLIFHVWLIGKWFGLDFRLAIWDSVVSNAILFSVTLLLSIGVLKYTPKESKFWYAVGLSFFLSIFCVLLSEQIILQLAVNNLAYIDFLEKSIPVRGCFTFLLMSGISLASNFQRKFEEQQGAMKREAETITMVKEAELQKLQTQLQPHFLFNSLNSINAMILTKPDEARAMVEQLSDFLRTTTKRADQHSVTLEEEWSYLQHYLAIEKVRFGHRLEVHTRFQPESLTMKIPTLVLQPLVENAIKYGLYGTTGRVVIYVKAIVNDRYVQINISNPYEKDLQPPSGSGFGLSGLRRRLYLLFAQNDLLQTRQSDTIFTVLLKIPTQA